MEILQIIIRLLCYFLFIGLSFQLLISLFDWSKLIKYPSEDAGRLRLFILFLSVGLGSLVASFVLTILDLSLRLFVSFS
ncbi:DUF1146 family protein [Streptococcus caprae]|uniref:DUF1146 family protein n=1 Tax=Streptococcus caprae TaxID=1640501 RepID=A0ABV8CSD3_9STRE